MQFQKLSTGSPVQVDETASGRLLRRILGAEMDHLRIEVYDGTVLGPEDAATTIRVLSPDFFTRIISGRGSELSLARSYVSGDVQVEGDIYGVLALRERIENISFGPGLLRDAAAARGFGWPGDIVKFRPMPLPPEEIRVHGRLHSRHRDAEAISSHYDVSNEFYRLFLGETMTYSCGVFNDAEESLDSAQVNKYDLICRKLGLQSGQRLLDIGCGWGGMALHAAGQYDANVLGITISEAQRDLATQRVEAAGLEGKVEIRLQDYRDLADDQFDAVSSIGMFEHVGEKRLDEYFLKIERLLKPGGRLLNHAINRSRAQRRAKVTTDSFMNRYVFPDGELLEPGQIVSAMNRSGFEVRHLESLREHYALTLRCWVGALEANWDEAVALTSEARARVWRLYMAGSALGFESNELNLTQVLATRTVDGASGMELTPHW